MSLLIKWQHEKHTINIEELHGLVWCRQFRQLYWSININKERKLIWSEQFVQILVEDLRGKDFVSSLGGMITIPEYVLGGIFTRMWIIQSITQYAHLYVSCATASFICHFKPCFAHPNCHYHPADMLKSHV